MRHLSKLGDRGAAAAELAMVMPAVVVILAAIIATALATVQLVRSATLASGLARSAAVGETAAELDRIVENSGLDAQISVETHGETACVTVKTRMLDSILSGVSLSPVTVCSLNVGA